MGLLRVTVLPPPGLWVVGTGRRDAREGRTDEDWLTDAMLGSS